MNNQNNHVKGWLSLILILLGIGTVKAGGHLLRFLILAAVGLCGMWMLHTLATDFNKIRKGFQSARSLLRLKRDLNMYDSYSMTQRNMSFAVPFIGHGIDENMSFLDQSLAGILEQDPKQCVKSFVCQIAAMNRTQWNVEENAIMRVISLTANNRYWPSMELQKAIKIGKRKNNIKDCQNQYASCPFKAETMLSILRMFKT